MAAKKERIDTSAAVTPLTDNPFAGLAGLRDALPTSPVPQVAPKAEILPDEPAAFRVDKTRKGGYNLAVERRAGGKVVTLLRGVDTGGDALLAQLKRLCGAGGAVRDGAIEIQGDHRARIEQFLKAKMR